MSLSPSALDGALLLAAALVALATLLPRVLPLGRVVSPVDALLNAAGAVVTGLVVAGMREHGGAGRAPG